jgi:hypothetical protein
MDAKQRTRHLRTTIDQTNRRNQKRRRSRARAPGRLETELRLRVVTTPDPATAQLLAHLDLRLPKGTREINNVVPKINL